MKNTIKVLSLLFILSLTAVACGGKSGECKEGDKKECCAKKAAEEKSDCKPGCQKKCCAEKEAEGKSDCKPGCEKQCCSKADADSATTETMGDEQAHACTDICVDEGSSCPHHAE